MGGQRRQGHRHCLTIPAGAGQSESEKGSYGVVEIVRAVIGASAEFGGEQGDALLCLPEIAQRTGQLDHRATTTLPGQT